MKKVQTLMIVALLLTAYCGQLTAQHTSQEFDVDLWPNGLPNTNGVDHLPYDEKTHNYKPSLRVYLPSEEMATGRGGEGGPGGAENRVAGVP
jgi:hypothetical protein